MLKIITQIDAFLNLFKELCRDFHTSGINVAQKNFFFKSSLLKTIVLCSIKSRFENVKQHSFFICTLSVTSLYIKIVVDKTNLTFEF